MLVTNYSYINQLCGHNHSGLTNPRWCLFPHTMRNYYLSRDSSNISNIGKDNFPVGTQPPYSYMMGDKGINTSATTTVDGNTNISYSNLAGGLGGESNLSGSGDITANISAIGAIISALSGLGTLTADITGKLEAASSLLGQGDIVAALGALSGALADIIGTGTLSGSGETVVSIFSNLDGNGTLTFTSDIIGVLQGACNLAGSSPVVADIVGAWYMDSGLTGTSSLASSLTAVANLISALTGSGLLAGSTNANGDLTADIIIGASDPLSAENLAAALWNSLAALYNNPGTMGEIMNNVGAGADPWNTLLPGAYGAGTAGKIVGENLDIKISEIWDESKLSHVTPDTMGKILQDLEKLVKQVKGLTTANL